AGMVLVLVAVLVVGSPGTELGLVLVGLLLVEGGVWRIASSVLPDERRYVALREESNRFVAMVRQLNAAAIALCGEETAGARLALEETKRAMHRSVERMVVLAGRSAEDVPADAPVELPDEAQPGRAASAASGSE
ncbi:MAG: hypothetical protein P8174_11755, partial [Gemmatimonadota bacterium]